MVSMLPHRVQSRNQDNLQTCNNYSERVINRFDSFHSLNDPQEYSKTKKTMIEVHDKSRNGIKWSDTEIEQLIHEAHDMKSLQEIADLHKRSISSIRYKLLQYAVRMMTAKVHVDTITKVLPLKKKEVLDYFTKIKEEEEESTEYVHKNGTPITFYGKYIPYEERDIILFDLNGTLCYRPKDSFKKETFIRPCVRHLSKLKNYYRLGIFTSVMRANALDILRLIENKCGRIFDRSLIFTREQTMQFSAYEQQTFNIPPYKTKKSIAHVLPDIYNNPDSHIKIKIIDDEIVKVVEKHNAVIIPTWDGYTEDSYLKELVEELISSKQGYIYNTELFDTMESNL